MSSQWLSFQGSRQLIAGREYHYRCYVAACGGSKAHQEQLIETVGR